MAKELYLTTALLWLIFSTAVLCEKQQPKQRIIKLPLPALTSTTSVEKALKQRRSVRTFTDKPLTLTETAQLLWAAQGITHGKKRKTAPSAGALYPLCLYIAVNRVKDLQPGIYKYIPAGHKLKKVVKGSFNSRLSQAALNQQSVLNSAVTFIFTCIYERTTGKYGRRGIRYVHMEAGHAAQNIYLQAVSLDIGTVVIGAFNGSQIQKIIQCQKKEKPVYIMPAGNK